MTFSSSGSLCRRRFLAQTLGAAASPLLLGAQERAQRDFQKRVAPAPDPPGPELLTFDEITRLYQEDRPSPELGEKLHNLLNTPFVSNSATADGVKPQIPEFGRLGRFVRVVQWNIERGLEFDAILFAFTDPRRFTSLMEDKGSKLREQQRDDIQRQAAFLFAADIIVLNEVDWGVNRTRFRNIGAELAQATRMNLVYGVEFVEVDPITMGVDQVLVKEVLDSLKRPGQSKAGLQAYFHEVMTPDPGRYHGLHGTAILSRYPLENVRVVPFAFQGHDWFMDEKKSGLPRKVQSAVAQTTFKEQLVRQVRRGGRMMLLAEVSDSSFPGRRATIVATHLEDVTTPANRRKQLDEILAAIGPKDHPVILAGDMNTSSQNGMPTTISRELKRRFGSAGWWAEEGATLALRYGTPYGWASTLSIDVADHFKNANDPTTPSLLFIGENPEAKFFSSLEDFRFADGSCFDFRGEGVCSINGKTGRLANSNERGAKGFVPTEELGRRLGTVGHYKLDWIFVPARRFEEAGRRETVTPPRAPLRLYTHGIESLDSRPNLRSQSHRRRLTAR